MTALWGSPPPIFELGDYIREYGNDSWWLLVERLSVACRHHAPVCTIESVYVNPSENHTLPGMMAHVEGCAYCWDEMRAIREGWLGLPCCEWLPDVLDANDVGDGR